MIEPRHHANLRTMSLRPDSRETPSRKKFRHHSSRSAKSTPPLPSPSIVAAHAYHLERSSPLREDEGAIQRRRSLVHFWQFPRRHYVLATPKALAVQLENFSFSTKKKDLQTVDEADEAAPKIQIEEKEGKEDTPMMDARDSGREVTPVRRRSDLPCGTPQEVLRQVPFQYTHDHLRDWGHAYLGNSATADAFVNAVSLRRPSIAMVQKDSMGVKPTIETSEVTTIRAKVVPRGTDRKPFLIQRNFDIEQLRPRIPRVLGQPGTDSPPPVLRRSNRARRPSAQLTTGQKLRRTSADSHAKGTAKDNTLDKGALPIHIEYALHYLPVLGALMLSGHVRKGDSIDLPMPAPEAWRDVLMYIYTGRGGLSEAMREDIWFLAGHA